MTDVDADAGASTPSTGVLLDVLLCPPDNFRWLPTSAISKATLDSGAAFDPSRRAAQHAELVSAYEAAGVTVPLPRARPGPALPGVRPRLERRCTPGGAVVTQLQQQWRRGEYAPVIRFYQERGIPIRRHDHRRRARGRRRDDRRARLRADRQRRGAHRVAGRRASSPAGSRRTAGRSGSSRSRAQFVHIDVLVAILAPKLAAVCVEAASGGLVGLASRQGLRAPRGLGRGRLQARRQRDLARRRAGDLDAGAPSALNEQMRARGLEVLDPDLEMFTLGGGGAHCLAQALRREPRRLSADARARRSTPARVIADLRELDRRTGGARRRAAALLDGRLARGAGLPRRAARRDRASSPRSTRRGTSGRGSRGRSEAPALASARTSTRSRTAAGSTARSG